MSIASEITRLQTAKANIKTSIENKGVTVPSNATLSNYPTYIDQITTGGGGGGDLRDLIERDITSVTIPSGTTTIGNYIFFNCQSLTSVTIPNSVTTVGNHAFSGCKTLNNIQLPNNVSYIDNYAFFGCKAFTSVTIPNSVTTVGSSAFESCGNLLELNLPNNNGFTYIHESLCKDCWALKRVNSIVDGECNIPNTIIYIEADAFKDCWALTSVNIPSSVRFIRSTAFQRCTSLTSITCLATTPPTLGSNVFDNTNNCPIYVPAESVDTYKAATNWSTYATRIQAIP